ncbi:MAG: kinesin family protein 2/24 [Bacillariaceae sp.]|jgi:kinesin family protein 2/24
MGLVSTWLNGIGLRSVVPTFEAAGIVSPAHLADLDVTYFESLGVTDPDDRRKLFYLVQRIKMAVKDKSGDDSNKGEGRGGPSNGRVHISVEERVDAVVSKNYVNENDDDVGNSVERNSENTLREEKEEEEENKVVEPTRRSKRIRTLVKKHKKKKKDDTKENTNNNETETPAPAPPATTRTSSSPLKSPSKRRTKIIEDEQENPPLKSPSKRRIKSIEDEQESSPSNSPSKRRTKGIKEEQENPPLKSPSKRRIKSIKDEQESSPSKSPSKRRTKSIKEEQENPPLKSPSKRRIKSIKDEQENPPLKSPSKRSSMKESISKLTKYKKNSKDEKVKVNHKDNVPSRSNPIPSKTAIPSSTSAFSEQSGNDSDDNNSDELTNSTIEKGLTKVIPETVQTAQKIDISQNKPSSRQPPKSKLTGPKRTDNRLPAVSSEPTTELQSPVMEYTSAVALNDDIEEFQSNSSSSHDISKQKRRITLAASIDSLENHFQPPISELLTEKNNNYKNTNVIGGNNGNSDITTSNNNYNRNQSRSLPKPTTSRSSKSMSASDSMLLQKHQRGHQTLPTISSTRAHSSKQDRSSIITQSSNEIAESWATQIDYLREDNEAEHDMFRDQVETENEYYDMRIKVIIRKRPLSKAEAKLTGGIDIIHPLDYGSYGRVLAYQPKTRVDLTKEVETVPFAFDNVFDESSTNIGIYERSLRNLVEPFFNGQWATVFAYGQTGSGKTYTMMGSNITGVNAGTADESNLGLYYLAALDIFKMMEMPEHSHLKVHVSLFEIYSGKLFDLLNERKQIKCLEDSKGKVCFPGLTEHPAHAPEHVMQLIEEGALNRSTGTTSRNADSSRSHAVLQIKLMKNGRKKNIEHGRFTFIDLAGSERGADTSNSSKATRLEGAEINTSLLALKEVIRALATGGSMSHIPFRGSKLTQVLKDSFVGENSRSCMVACISPDIGNCDQTLNTLRYADRVKERNPESGDLPTTCQQPTKQKTIQCSRFSAKQPPQQQRNMIDQDSRIERYEDQGANHLIDETHHIDIGAKGALEALTEPPNIPKAKAKAKTPRKVNVTEKQKAGQALVSNHRSVMSRWLKMVKDEMNSVNQVDAERDGIDNYLLELQNLQSNQIDFISELRSSLQTYVSASEGQFQTVADHDDDDSFESFDDLRD